MFGVAGLLFSVPFLFASTDAGIIAMDGAIVLVMAGFGVYLTFWLIGAARTRISITGTALAATVPHGRSWLWGPRFRTIALPLGKIRSVERRQEIVQRLGLTKLRESLSVVTSTGERIGLFANGGGAASLPIDEIAAAIASAAGIAVTHDAPVLSGATDLYGEASSSWTEPPLDAASATKARRAAAITGSVVLALVFLTVMLRGCG